MTRQILTEVFYRGASVTGAPGPTREREIARVAAGLGVQRDEVTEALGRVRGGPEPSDPKLAHREALIRALVLLTGQAPEDVRTALDVLELNGDPRDPEARAQAQAAPPEGEPLSDAERVVEILLSSETPVRRWFGNEVLDHRRGAIDTTRLDAGAPLLLQHEGDPYGVIERYRVRERALSVWARFGRGPLAERVNRDVLDGIWRAASVGYVIHAMKLEESKDDAPDSYRATLWEPLEASLVSVGADPTAGPARELERHHPTQIIGEPIMTNETTTPVEVRSAGGTGDGAAAAAEKERDFRSQERELATVERDRQREIHAIRKEYPTVRAIQDAALAALEGGTPLGEFQARVAEILRTPAPLADETPPNEIGMTRKEVERFSLQRWMLAVAESQDGGRSAADLAPFEFEVSQAVNDALSKFNPGHRVRGVPAGAGEIAHAVPWTLAQARRAFGLERLVEQGVPEGQLHTVLRLPAEVLADWNAPHRAHLGATFRAPPMDTSGSGALVGTDHLAGSFIDALREISMFLSEGAIEMPGLVGNVSIPRQTGAATFTWVAEDGDSLDTETPLDSVTMSPKTLTGSVPITRRLLKQSAPSVEMIVRNDLTVGAAETLDRGILNGGTNAPTGIIGTTGVQIVTIATPGRMTWPEALEFEADFVRVNAMRQTPVWYLSAGANAHTKATPKVSGAGATGFIQNGDGINGWRVRTGAQMLEGSGNPEILAGDPTTVLVGMWGVLDLYSDTATNAQKGRLTLRAFQDADSAVRHGQAWAKGTNVV